MQIPKSYSGEEGFLASNNHSRKGIEEQWGRDRFTTPRMIDTSIAPLAFYLWARTSESLAIDIGVGLVDTAQLLDAYQVVQTPWPQQSSNPFQCNLRHTPVSALVDWSFIFKDAALSSINAVIV